MRKLLRCKRLLPNKSFLTGKVTGKVADKVLPLTSERVFSSAKVQARVQAWVQGAAAAPDNPYNRSMWQRLFRDKGQEDLAQNFWQNFEEEVAQARSAIEAQAFSVSNRATLLDALRQHLSGLDGLLVLRGDRYGNEFLQPSAERLRFFSGFSGSFGWAILDFRAGKKSLVASDARYRLQLRAECDAALFETRETSSSLQNIAPTLCDTFGTGRIGYDPWQVSERLLSTIKQRLPSKALRLVPVSTQRIDAVWQGKPPAPLSLLSLRTKRETGESPQQRQKRIVERIVKRIRDKLAEHPLHRGDETLLLTASDAVAWALCLRASDLPFLPVALGFAMLNLEGGKSPGEKKNRRARFFSNPRPVLIGEDLSHIEMRAEETLATALDEQAALGNPLLLDTESVPSALVRACRRRKIPLRFVEDPTQDLRLCKTPRERANMRRAHLWDGIAWVRFFAWLARAGERKESVCEHTAACQLQAFRQQSGKLLDESFKTISASGANAAMIHYPTPSEHASLLRDGTPYLIDSGGQYAEGTTDLTRTLVYGGGRGTEAFRQAYTAVLRGHIALATSLFPEGTQASALDALARRALWQRGWDYPHATGHGVGFCLSVHEGSVRIAQQSQGTNNGASKGQPPLQLGMILSNEPGFYLPRQFGIRIENLLEVVDLGKKNSEGKRILGFHTLSLAPIALAPIVRKDMEAWEQDWLNAYHARLRETIIPHLKEAFERNFLKQATKPLT